MTNSEFLQVIKESFKTYLEKNTSRSPAKLKSLHGKIATDLQQTLGTDFTIQAQGYGNGDENFIQGRYINKRVDITVCKNGTPVAGYAVKFVMRNYSQNSNNYFESMLGETANIRSNNIPYFQIFVIFDEIPYYDRDGYLQKYEHISQHHLHKYVTLSQDNTKTYFHTPDKTLIVLLTLKKPTDNYIIHTSHDYATYYLSKISDNDLIEYSNFNKSRLGNSVILNDYQDFVNRTKCIIVGQLKN